MYEHDKTTSVILRKTPGYVHIELFEAGRALGVCDYKVVPHPEIQNAIALVTNLAEASIFADNLRNQPWFINMQAAMLYDEGINLILGSIGGQGSVLLTVHEDGSTDVIKRRRGVMRVTELIKTTTETSHHYVVARTTEEGVVKQRVMVGTYPVGCVAGAPVELVQGRQGTFTVKYKEVEYPLEMMFSVDEDLFWAFPAADRNSILQKMSEVLYQLGYDEILMGTASTGRITLQSHPVGSFTLGLTYVRYVDDAA